MNNNVRMKQIESLLHETLTISHLEVIDDSAAHAGHSGAQSGAGHYTLKIMCEEFNEKSLIECHRLVYGALASMMPNEIHALVIKIA